MARQRVQILKLFAISHYFYTFGEGGGVFCRFTAGGLASPRSWLAAGASSPPSPASPPAPIPATGGLRSEPGRSVSPPAPDGSPAAVDGTGAPEGGPGGFPGGFPGGGVPGFPGGGPRGGGPRGGGPRGGGPRRGGAPAEGGEPGGGRERGLLTCTAFFRCLQTGRQSAQVFRGDLCARPSVCRSPAETPTEIVRTGLRKFNTPQTWRWTTRRGTSGRGASGRGGAGWRGAGWGGGAAAWRRAWIPCFHERNVAGKCVSEGIPHSLGTGRLQQPVSSTAVSVKNSTCSAETEISTCCTRRDDLRV